MHVRGKTENESTKPLPYTWPETKHPSIIKTKEKRDTTGRHDKEMPTEGVEKFLLLVSLHGLSLRL